MLKSRAVRFFIAGVFVFCSALFATAGENGEWDALPKAAQETIIADYIAQADAPYADLCASEVERMRSIALRLGTDKFNERISQIEKRLGQPDKDLYIKARILKREMMLSGIDFRKILCVDAPYPEGPEAVHEGRIKTENTACFGGRISIVDIGKFREEKKVFPAGDSEAAVGRVDLSFDASKIVFSAKVEGDTNYHLYSMGLGGGDARKLTRGLYNDSDPAWLPDGGIVFTTSRSNHYLRCGGNEFRLQVLARCDADGKNIYFISTNNESDSMPYVMDDGRILYCRWEYVDKNIFRLQSFWTINPDGTNSQVFWGNQSHWPDNPICAIQIPGTEKFLFQSASHHNVYRAGLGVLEPSKGINYPDGIYNLTPHIGWAEAGVGPKDKAYNDKFRMSKNFSSFYTPYPVCRDMFLVSARMRGKHPIKTAAYSFEDGLGLEGSLANRCRNTPEDWMSLYLADYDGNMELVYKGLRNIQFAQPLRPRATPRIVESSVVWPGDKSYENFTAPGGVLYSANVYENSGIPFGQAKYLRVVEHCAPTYADGVRDATKEWLEITKALGIAPDLPFIAKDPSLSKHFLSGETSMSILLDESHKRILGEVPIEADGSVHVKIPSMRAVYFQLLDKDRKLIQTMRSSTHVMPGEMRGCLGCHSTQTNVAPPRKPALALRKPAAQLENRFADRTFGFARTVQPILDKHCVSCHNSKDGHWLSLEGKKLLKEWNFTVSYLNLVLGVKGREGKQNPHIGYAAAIFPYHTYPNPDLKVCTEESVIKPMSVLSGKSKLVDMLQKGHNKVALSEREMDLLKAWIDLNCPFYGEEDILEMPDIDEAKYYSNKRLYKGLSYAPKMRTSPDVDRSFRQDKFDSPQSRMPRAADGTILPAIRYEGDKRIVTLP